MQEEYIDCSTVYTHKRDGSDGNELVAYRYVIEELAKIAGKSIPGARYIPSNIEGVNSTTVIIVISVTALCSITAVSLILIKKRKHQ